MYFATALGLGSQGILLWVPKDQVIATAIGRLQDLGGATAEEAQLLSTLKAANPTQPGKETVVCTLRDNSGDVIERRTYTRKLGAQPAPCEENGG